MGDYIPPTGQTQIYIVCDGIVSVPITVGISELTTCQLSSTWIDAEGYTHEEWKQKFRVNLSQAAPQAFIIDHSLTRTKYSGYVVVQEYQYYTTKSIPAGVTVYDFEIMCRTSFYLNKENPITTFVWDRLILWSQNNVPLCAPQETGCTLYIDGIGYPPAVLNGNDGYIVCTAHDARTPSVSWSINGVLDTGNSNTFHIFYGLTPGTYYILAEEDGCYWSIIVEVPNGKFITGGFTTIEPSHLCAVENPIVLQLSTAENDPNPKYSISTFVIPSGAFSGCTITFDLEFPQIYHAEFKSKSYPDQTNYFLERNLTNELGVLQSTNTPEEIATSLSECFQNDNQLSRIYYITNSGATVTLISKEFGYQYNLDTQVDITYESISSPTITQTLVQGGISQYEGSLVADYSLYTEIFVNQLLQYGQVPVLSDYKRVAELELPYDRSNIHTFDLSTVLKNFVSSPKFDFNFTGYTALPSMDTSWYCKYGEKYPLVPNSNTKKKKYKGATEVGYCLNSALDYEAPNDMDKYLGYQYNPTGGTRYGVVFLNTAPYTKYIQRGSHEFLYFMLEKDYQYPIFLRGDIYYYNGQSNIGETFFQITTSGGSTNFGGVNALACGYNELGLAAYEASGNTKIRKVQFAVWQKLYDQLDVDHVTGCTECDSSGDTDTVEPPDPNELMWVRLTEKRTYLLEIDEQPNRFDVAFLNKLGTYETFSFIGEVQEGQDIERDSYQQPYKINSDGSANIGFNYNTTYNTQHTKTFVVNTGIIDADTYYYLMGMLQSNTIYNYGIPYQNYLIVTNVATTKSTNNQEYTVQVSFKQTISENNVSK